MSFEFHSLVLGMKCPDAFPKVFFVGRILVPDVVFGDIQDIFVNKPVDGEKEKHHPPVSP